MATVQSALGIWILTIVVVSCSTTSKNQEAPKTTKVSTARSSSSKSPASTVSSNRYITPKKPVQPMISDSDYLVFFSRLATQEGVYGDLDRQFFMKIPSTPKSGTIHEAAMAVGLLRDILTPVAPVATSSFKETTLTPQAQSSNTPNPAAVILGSPSTIDPARIIETRSRERGMDFITALSGNPYLKTAAIYGMAYEAIRIDGNTQAFVQNATTVIRSEMLIWMELSRRMGLDAPVATSTTSQVPMPVPGTSPVGAPEAGVTTGATVPVVATLSPAENAAAQRSLAQAQDLANKDDYEKAVEIARKIPPQSDSGPAAADNVKTWSNKAVQDLRRQAANQYRSSSVTSETVAKKAYLDKAKTLLENAMQKYPEASSLDTVKENLEIINGELSRFN